MNRRTLIVLTGALAARTFIPTTQSIADDRAPEQNWPQRTVKIILPFGPGSAADIAARIFADRLSPRWRRPVVVENRPSSDGLVAIAAFVSADDDHTLLYSSGAVFIPHPFVHEKLPYDAARDLIPIAGIADISIGIIVPQSLQVDSLAELEALARAQPGKLNWGAITSLDDFVFSGFLKNSGLAMSRVPYRDPVQALNDISEGRIDATLAALALELPRVQSGKVKLLAVVNRQRSPTTPNVPTAIEAGYPALSYGAYGAIGGLFGPRIMSPETRERISQDLRAICNDHAVVSRLAPTGQIVTFVPSADFAAGIEEERARVAAIAKVLGIKPGHPS
jgi:tripartite-type tricarboxylate transporter receptor subunit TctC